MFFGLLAIDDHPCCKMQEVVEAFFLNSINSNAFSLALFPDWIQATLSNSNCTLAAKFLSVHALLHAQGVTSGVRIAIYKQLQATNRVENLCDGSADLPDDCVDWNSALGEAIIALMKSLYDSLDLAVFRRPGELGQPTHQFYVEFIEKNKYVCPFCGIHKFKNSLGASREDFDHYLHKSDYPLAAANMKNLFPTCGICNQDYKKTKDILADGAAFYPYSTIPEIKIEVNCETYPVKGKTKNKGRWSVKLELVQPDPVTGLKIKAWKRVYSIKERLENEISQFCEDWIIRLFDDLPRPLAQDEFIALIASAKIKAINSSQRRMEAGEIIKAAFFDFMLSRAKHSFVESFRILQNKKSVASNRTNNPGQ